MAVIVSRDKIYDKVYENIILYNEDVTEYVLDGWSSYFADSENVITTTYDINLDKPIRILSKNIFDSLQSANCYVSNAFSKDIYVNIVYPTFEVLMLIYDLYVTSYSSIERKRHIESEIINVLYDKITDITENNLHSREESDFIADLILHTMLNTILSPDFIAEFINASKELYMSSSVIKELKPKTIAVFPLKWYGNNEYDSILRVILTYVLNE